TFFLDVLMEHTHGREALERTVTAIAERGHDPQLHLHPEHLARAADPAAREIATGEGTPEERFERVLDHALELFASRVGRAPVAYRAGGYRIADWHFPLLERAGIAIDSSVHPYFNARVSDWMKARTQPFWVGGVLELPPSWLLLTDDPERWEPRAFAPNHAVG